MRTQSRKQLTQEQMEDIRVLAAMKESEVDLSDMPEVRDWKDAKVGKFFRKRAKKEKSRSGDRRSRG